MKALAALSTAVLLCLFAVSRTAIAQGGEGYICGGPQPFCPPEYCKPLVGKCPDNPGQNYNWVSQASAGDLYVCFPGGSSCVMVANDNVTCGYYYYVTKTQQGVCSNKCGEYSYEVLNCAPLS
ncbi:MAG: hypothetical protein ACP5XB_15350 [Isosphaeraceae bacterium]